MARYRSRRSNRRSASQSAASLLALALPAPIQRVADTRLGPLLMLIGVPSMLVAGLLQVNWSNGLPSVAVDPHAAASVLQRTSNGLEQQGGLGHLASDFLNGVSHSSHQNNYGQAYPSSQQPIQSHLPTSNFPSTQPQSAATQRDYRYTTTQPTTQTTNSWGQQSTYAQQPTHYQQPPYQQPPYQQPQYQQPQYTQQPTYGQQATYGQQSSHTQQPTYTQQPSYNQQSTYSQSGYQHQPASPSDNRNLTQQQLYQQQQYQQQVYEQQLRDKQYRQWQAQQPNTGTQQHSATGYAQQYDTYGRPVSTGYGQTTHNYSQPTPQYGQQNYNQGYLPNMSTSGRY